MQPEPALGVAAPYAAIANASNASASSPPIDDAPLHADAWVARFLSSPIAARESTRGSTVDRIRHAGVCCALASSYGVAFAAASGATTVLRDGLAVSFAWIAVAMLGVPALGITLSLADAPVAWTDLADATGRALARGTLVLAGLSPTLALYACTVDDPRSAALLGGSGLALAWSLALTTLIAEIVRRAEGARAVAVAACAGFAVFSTILVARIWSAQLVGGAS